MPCGVVRWADGLGAFRLLLPDWNRKLVLIASGRVEAEGFLTLQVTQLDQPFAPTAPPALLVLRGRNTILTLLGPELDLKADSFLLVWCEGTAGADGDWILRHGGSYRVQESAASAGRVIGLPPGRFLFGSESGETREAITLTSEDGAEDLAAVLRDAGLTDRVLVVEPQPAVVAGARPGPSCNARPRWQGPADPVHPQFTEAGPLLT